MKNFLMNKVNFIANTDCFLTHHYHIYIEKEGSQTIRAYEADFKSRRKHILSTLGEYFEREVLINKNPIHYDACKMVSMVNGSIKIVPTSELIFKDKFVDSCGMASHTLTQELVWKAYKEYFERQSFIANFLFELPADKIKIRQEPDLCKMHKYLTINE